MSDIDRIVRKTIVALFGKGDVVQVEETIRAALLECGAIVREECAQVALTYADDADGEYASFDTREVSKEIACTIRRMNAHQG